MNHYVTLHRQSLSATTVVGVFHEPSAPIAWARHAATSACVNTECYEEKVAAGKEVFRATYGVAGECFLVEKVPVMPPALEPGGPTPAPAPPEKAKAWIIETLTALLNGEWELVEALPERDHIVRELPGSPFLGKLPGSNLHYSLHLRLNAAGRALLEVSDEDRARVRATLGDGEQ